MKDYTQIPLDDEDVWDLICSGYTQGVFQLETSLGKSWVKKIKPRNIEELAAVLTLIRPGGLKAKIDNKTVIQHYVDRKHGLEEPIPIHPALTDILRDTYQLILYQEQQLEIAKEIAGFSLVEADILRDAVGKKKSDELARLRPKFIDGCEATGKVTRQDAIAIYDVIEKSARYIFNKSHSVSYAMVGYYTAYAKTKSILKFFQAYLKFAKEKPKPQEEIQALISESKIFDLPIYGPSIDKVCQEFSVIDDNIYFGLENIKGVGAKNLDKFLPIINQAEQKLGKPVSEFSWFEFLSNITATKTIGNNLISVGALSPIETARRKMLYEFNVWGKLTDREKTWIRQRQHEFTSLEDSIVALIYSGLANKRRRVSIEDLLTSLQNPPYSLADSPRWIIDSESKLLGVSLTYHPTDCYDVSSASTTCKEFLDGKSGNMSLAVIILDVSVYTIKGGKDMAFLKVEDASCGMDIVCFSDLYSDYQDVIYQDNIVLLTGYRSDKDSFVARKVTQLNRR